jgi:hypothetical protein
VFNGNGLNTNIAQGSLFGSPQAFQSLLTKLVGPNVGLDALNAFHPGSIQYRGGNDNGPDPHLSFDNNHRPGANGLLFQPFHYDGAFPFGDVSGFVEHTSSVLKSLFETKVLRQRTFRHQSRFRTRIPNERLVFGLVVTRRTAVALRC